MAQVRKTKWNPRYVEYARSHGRTPEEQQDHDRADKAWGGGFLHWAVDRFYEAAAEIPQAFTLASLTDPAAYDAWLTRWVDEHRNVSASDLVS